MHFLDLFIFINNYAKNFHPTENNQRNFTKSLYAVEKSIKDINKQLNQKNDDIDNLEDFSMVSDTATNLTPQEAMEHYGFKKDDFNNTRIQF